MAWSKPDVKVLYECLPGERMLVIGGYGDGLAIIERPDRPPIFLHTDGRQVVYPWIRSLFDPRSVGV